MTTDPKADDPDGVPLLSFHDRRGGMLLVSFQMTLAPGATGFMESRPQGPALARRLVVSPLCAPSVRVIMVLAGVQPLLPFTGDDGISGTLFPPLLEKQADRVAPWANVRAVPMYPGMSWRLEAVNSGAAPIRVDACLFGRVDLDAVRG
jgi:hypothetical protein